MGKVVDDQRHLVSVGEGEEGQDAKESLVQGRPGLQGNGVLQQTHDVLFPN